MKKTLTRVLSLVLVLTMFLSTAPLALAAEGDPEVIPMTAVTIEGPSNGIVAMGGKGTISAVKTPSNTTEKLAWVSSNEEVATVSSGAVSPKAPGTTTITAKSRVDETVVSNPVTIRVAYVPSVSSSTLTVEAGQQVSVPTVSVPGLDSFSVNWTASSGVTVNNTTGMVTGVTAGSATLTGTISGAEAGAFYPSNTVTVNVTVTPAQAGSYVATLEKTAYEIEVGDVLTLPTRGQLKGLDGLTTVDYTLSDWVSTDNEVTIASGKATGANVGTATLTASITVKKEGITINDDALVITVKVKPDPRLKTSDSSKEVDFGASIDAPEVQGMTGLTKGTDYTVTWSSSNTDVVSVVDNAKFKGNSIGTATLTGKVVVTKDGFEMTENVTCTVKVVSDLYLEVPETIEIAAGDTYTVKKPVLKGTGASNATITDWTYTRLAEGTSTNTSISGNIITASRTGRDMYKVTATVTKNGETVSVPELRVPVSVYGEIGDITVVLKDSASSFTFDDKSVYTSLKLGLTEVLNTYDSVEELLIDVVRDHMSDRSSYLIDYPITFTSMVGAGGDLSHTSGGTLRDDFTMDSLDRIKYTKDSGTATKSRFTYNVWDNNKMLVMTGAIVIDYKDTAEIVYYTDGDPVTFDEEDFEEFWDDYGTNYNLDYVQFTDLPYTSEGKLYTTANMSTAVKTTYKFEPDHTTSSYYDLDTVTFDPASNFSGTVYIPFTAVDYYGNKITGNVAITDEEEGAEIEYYTDGTPVIFDEDDFVEFWDDYGTSYNLDYVTFDDLPYTSEGILYTNSSQTTKVTVNHKFKANYTTSSTYKDLDTVTFDPAANADGTIYIPFTAYGTDDKYVSGDVAIIIGGDSDLTITKLGFRFGQTSAKLDKVIAEEFEDEKNEELDYVLFTIPSKEIGQLFYDYNLTTDTLLDGELITSKTKLYYDATGSQYDLADVHFFPSECCPENVTLSYTAYGEDGSTYKGTVNLTVISQDSSSKFTDVKGGTGWAADSVDFLRYHGVVNGVTDTTFGPSNKITRGDFMLMLYRAFLADEYEDTTITSNFADVTKGTSDYSKELYQAVGVAKKLGIATGDGTNYYPKKNISREEAMTLIYRTLDELNISLTVTSNKDTGDFTDYSKVSTYAKDPIEYLIEHDIVRGDAGKINPKNNITRAEMAVILHRVLTF